MTALVEMRYQLPADKDKRTAIYECISTSHPKRRVTILRRPGWIDGKFLLPGKTIGQKKTDNPKTYFKSAPGAYVANYGENRSLEDHKKYVAEPAASSKTITFSMCFAIAAPLINLCGLEGGGVHCVAPSSSGKSLGLLAARSVCGEASRGDLTPWRTTANALERVAYAFNDGVLCIDDSSRLPGTKEVRALTMREVAYTLAGGQGKLRFSTAKGAVPQEVKWKIHVLSNGEEAIADIVEDGGTTRLGGEEVRLADLPCTVSEYGIFEKLPKGASNFDEAVKLIEDACSKYYGTPLRAFLKIIVQQPNRTRATVRELMAEFLETALIGNDGWESRFAKKFAVAYAAGVLAVRAKIFPWSEKHVERSVLDCYRRARAAIPDMDTLIERAMKVFNQSLADEERVLDLRKMKQKQREQLKPPAGLGFLRFRREFGQHLAILPNDFEKWFERAQDVQLALQQLDKFGRLKRDGSVPTRQIKMPWGGSKLRYYVITI